MDHLIVTMLLIVSAGVAFYIVRINHSVLNRPFASAFDVPSIFNHSHGIGNTGMQSIFNHRTETNSSIYSSLKSRSAIMEGFSNSAASKAESVFRYTHITERMTIVHTSH